MQILAIRSLVAETHLKSSDFIAPLFIDEGKDTRQEIASMPGYYRNSLDITIREVKELYSIGLKSVLLFVKAKDELKDNTGKEAWKKKDLCSEAYGLSRRQFRNCSNDGCGAGSLFFIRT